MAVEIMANRLLNANSLYLRQHAENPVDWYPWGEEAFAKARAEDKPLLISIGYSSCHWCHVMAHESFEDAYIARLMNTHFVCIKVDREERPDVDQIYMDAVQMLNGHGGWPLNVFCLSDGRPFAGGTYFPPDERRGYNIVPWPQLLMRVSDYYRRQRPDLEENARAIVGNLQATNEPRGKGSGLQRGVFLGVMQQLLDGADLVRGGFGGAPKFPPCSTLDFLMAMRASATVESRFPEQAAKIDAIVGRTLKAMACGGIFDQIGGGFARYSVDADWLIPHFEKMLYDNAQLIDLYSRAWQRDPQPLYRKVVEETIGWLQREMQMDNGAFAAALDADTDGEEGLTYLWSPEEVRTILGEERGGRFCAVYGISAEGNFEATGLSNPSLQAAHEAERDAMAAERAQLLKVRNQRPQPGRDDKCLTAWNALLAKGLARAAFAFNKPEWLQLARQIGKWIWCRMRRDEDRLYSVAYGNEPTGNGHLEDYAYSAEAFLAIAAVVDWQEPGLGAIWRERAATIAGAALRHFKDPDGPGFFYTSDDHESLIHRKKDWFDSATPSGNASMLRVLMDLAHLTGQPKWAAQATALVDVWGGLVESAPAATCHALAGAVYEAIGIATLKFRSEANLAGLRDALASPPWRPVVWMADTVGDLPAAFQLCVVTTCQESTDDLNAVAELL